MHDIIVIGTGFAGSAAAILLSRQGFDVATVDKHVICPRQFRAEQLVGHQVDSLDRLGLLHLVVGNQRCVAHATGYENGRRMGRVRTPHYGVDYADQVNGLRCAIPAEVKQHIGMVTAIDTTDTIQTVALADGTRLQARLVVLATGLHRGLNRQLGATTDTILHKHSTAIGFDVAMASPPGDVIVYQGDSTNRVDYITIFPFKNNRLRANVFGYDGPVDWHSMLPRLRAVVGQVEVASTPELWGNHICVSRIRRPGVVAIGDSLQTPCPSAGTGIGRLLVDVEALCRHAPQWLHASADRSERQIEVYHKDPIRNASCAKALHDARYMRERRLGTSIGWKLHRFRVRSQARMMGAAG